MYTWCEPVCQIVQTVMMQGDLLPSPSQRIAALTLLHQLPTGPAGNITTPFQSLLLELVVSTTKLVLVFTTYFACSDLNVLYFYI